MKKKNLKIALASTLLLSSGAFGQKMMETSAALEYNSFEMCFMKAAQTNNKKAMAECKDNYDKAKTYIDKAAEHPDTKESAKTQLYKAKIYIGSMYAYAEDTTYLKENAEKNLEIGLAALKKANEDKKFKADAKAYVDQNVYQYGMGASMMYKQEKYAEAAGLYDLSARFSEAIGKIDSMTIYNAGVMYQQSENYEKAAEKFKKLAEIGYKPSESYTFAIRNLVDAKKLDEVKSLIEEAIKKYPNDKDVLIECVNYYFSVNDMVTAQELLDRAVQQDPKNHVLLYNIGTINLTQGNYEKAESSLKKAIEIKPDYYDAEYQLGVLYVNKYAKISEELDNMKVNNPKFKVLEAEGLETANKAIPHFEKYLTKNPNDKQTLLNMTKIYRAVGNNEKAMEYKKRADAIQ